LIGLNVKKDIGIGRSEIELVQDRIGAAFQEKILQADSPELGSCRPKPSTGPSFLMSWRVFASFRHHVPSFI
jgi:hypothetical protein